MNLKTAKRIRKALAYKPSRHTTAYEKLQIHHLAKHPTFETHERVLTHYDPRLGKVYTPVTKIRYDHTGKTPLRPLFDVQADGTSEPLCELHPVAKPVRLREGSPRRVYRLMKHLQRTVGLDKVFEQLVLETAVPA